MGSKNNTNSKHPTWKYLADYYNLSDQQVAIIVSDLSLRKKRETLDYNYPAFSGAPSQIWNSKSRSNQEEMFSFWREIKGFYAFKQTAHNHGSHYKFLYSKLKDKEFTLCEYGSGIGPVSSYLIEQKYDHHVEFHLTDVDCDHLDFGIYKLTRKIQENKMNTSVSKIVVQPNCLPLSKNYDAITIFDTFEHLPNPLAVINHIFDHLKIGGILGENYVTGSDKNGLNLPISQDYRSLVFNFIEKNFEFLEGARDFDKYGEKDRYWVKTNRSLVESH